MREERLVGGDDVLAGAERLEDERARGLEPADQLDDDRDTGIAHDVVDGLEDAATLEILEVEALARRVLVEVRDGGELETAPRTLFERDAL
jgi:hypothetical protein